MTISLLFLKYSPSLGIICTQYKIKTHTKIVKSQKWSRYFLLRRSYKAVIILHNKILKTRDLSAN